MSVNLFSVIAGKFQNISAKLVCKKQDFLTNQELEESYKKDWHNFFIFSLELLDNLPLKLLHFSNKSILWDVQYQKKQRCRGAGNYNTWSFSLWGHGWNTHTK